MEILTYQLINIFEIEEIRLDMVLRDLELWDSLSVISLLAVLDETYGIILEASELVELVTIGDLFSFVEQHRKK
jgi:acyl carrier protein